MIGGHGGNIIDVASRIGCAPEDIIDFSSNVNPLGPLPDLVEYLHAHLERIAVLPDAAARPAINAFAARHEMDPNRILAGNGTTQFIYLIPAALNTQKALILGPTYADYADACRMHRVSSEYLTADEAAGYFPNMQAVDRAAAAADTVFICNPNNPTGVLLRGSEIRDLCRTHSQTRFVVDESYLAFVDRGEKESLLASELKNCLVLHSMSKIHRIAGLRLGYLIAVPSVIDVFRPYMQPWSVNGLAQAAAVFMVEHRHQVDRFINRTRDYILQQKRSLLGRLKLCPNARLYPSRTLFYLARLSGSMDASNLQRRLLETKLLIRNCANFEGLTPYHFRISLQKEDANRQLTELLCKILA